MQLSKFTDYAFRTLIYLARNRKNNCIVEELAEELSISEHHLKKVVNKLAKTNFIISTKGRNGGLKLGLDPKEINLGEVIKLTEENLNIVECMLDSSLCQLMNSGCKLKGIISNSLDAFIKEMGKYTLQDIL